MCFVFFFFNFPEKHMFQISSWIISALQHSAAGLSRPSGPKVQNLCRRLGYLEDEAFGPFPGAGAVQNLWAQGPGVMNILIDIDES